MTGALIFTPDRNVHGNDYAGAFQPAAQQFANMHLIPQSNRCAINVASAAPLQRAQVRAKIEATPGLDTIAFFCHGWLSGIQLGITRPHVAGIVQSIAAMVSPEVQTGVRLFRVALYACSAGGDMADSGAPGGDGDFADVFRDELCLAGLANCQVDAHATRGHTSQNPHVRRFTGDGSPTGGHGGSWIVTPQGRQWRTWQRLLRTSDLQWRFPMMSVSQIHAELMTAAPAET